MSRRDTTISGDCANAARTNRCSCPGPPPIRFVPTRYSTLIPPGRTVTNVLTSLFVVTSSPSRGSTRTVTLYSPGFRGV